MMDQKISLFVHSLFLENIETEISVSQEYIIQNEMTLLNLIDSFCGPNRNLRFKFLDEQNNLRPNINIFIDSNNYRKLDGLETKIKEGTEVSIFPALSGG